MGEAGVGERPSALGPARRVGTRRAAPIASRLPGAVPSPSVRRGRRACRRLRRRPPMTAFHVEQAEEPGTECRRFVALRAPAAHCTARPDFLAHVSSGTARSMLSQRPKTQRLSNKCACRCGPTMIRRCGCTLRQHQGGQSRSAIVRADLRSGLPAARSGSRALWRDNLSVPRP